jgi:hypothetical protein
MGASAPALVSGSEAWRSAQRTLSAFACKDDDIDKPGAKS